MRRRYTSLLKRCAGAYQSRNGKAAGPSCRPAFLVLACALLWVGAQAHSIRFRGGGLLLGCICCTDSRGRRELWASTDGSLHFLQRSLCCGAVPGQTDSVLPLLSGTLTFSFCLLVRCWMQLIFLQDDPKYQASTPSKTSRQLVATKFASSLTRANSMPAMEPPKHPPS